MKKLICLLMLLMLFSAVFAAPPPPPDTGPDYYYVDVNVVGGTNDGSSLENAFSNIQDGIDAAADGDFVLVASGTYSSGSTQTPGYTLQNRIVIDKTVSVTSIDGASVTFIEGSEASGGGNGSDAIRAVYMEGGTLNGFTISDGHTNTSGDADLDRSGGGFYQSGGTVKYCIFTANSSDNNGGAGYISGASKMECCLIYGNAASSGGSGVYMDAGGTVTNCTITDNTSSGNGGGAYMASGGTLENCIVWGNTATSGNDIYDDGSGTVVYTCASDGLSNGVNGCTTTNPDFLDANNNDYRIFIDSPCYNSGNNTYSNLDLDLDDNGRILFETVDMGAYETEGVDVTFTDGSSYTYSLLKNTNNQPIGRFLLTGNVNGATISDASIKFDGTRTGLNNFKLWASNDASFESGGDTQLGGTQFVDPGLTPVDYISFSSAITSGGTYYFVTVDVGESGSGSVQGIIVQTDDLTLSGGTITATLTNEVLSSSSLEIPTPICLRAFTAEAKMGKVNKLDWVTESETENSHFIIYRDGEAIGRVEGNGTTTEQHSYTFLDTRAQGGMHSYAIADVSYGGVEELHPSVEVEVETELIEASFVLYKAYPNPFNPSVTINYQLSTFNKVSAFIYNTYGNMIKELLNDEMDAGSHTLTWNADGMPSGVYVVKMIVGNVVQSQKIVLMK